MLVLVLMTPVLIKSGVTKVVATSVVGDTRGLGVVVATLLGLVGPAKLVEVLEPDVVVAMELVDVLGLSVVPTKCLPGVYKLGRDGSRYLIGRLSGW